MNDRINQLRDAIEPLRQEIINHKVYSVIKNSTDLNVFMQHHVYAVWDFMSLLKTLQNNLTCTSIPWVPKGSADTRYLINEIVIGEESDLDHNGNRTSHFELYLAAMTQCGADTSEIISFIDNLKSAKTVQEALQKSQIPITAKSFINFTFNVINSQKEYLQAAVFTFGREDLIPSMFVSIINEIHKNFPNDISIFKYYIERHIEVDGGHHSNLALQMTANLCGDNDAFWQDAENTVKLSLKSRIALWDGIFDELSTTKVNSNKKNVFS